MPAIRKFKITTFWKNQQHESATKLPESYINAPYMIDAVKEYIDEHHPWLNDTDIDLVMQHTTEV